MLRSYELRIYLVTCKVEYDLVSQWPLHPYLVKVVQTLYTIIVHKYNALSLLCLLKIVLLHFKHFLVIMKTIIYINNLNTYSLYKKLISSEWKVKDNSKV